MAGKAMTSSDDDPAEHSEPPSRCDSAAGVDCADTPPQHVAAGVQFDTPAMTFVGDGARLDPGSSIGAGVQIRGDVRVGAGARIDCYSVIEDSSVGAGAHVGSFCTIRSGSELSDSAVVRDRCDLSGSSVASDAEIGPGALVEDSVVESGGKVGPFSRVRAGSRVGKDAYVGTHAEVKASEIGEGSKVGHFSFIGDAVLGANVNIGAGAVTANYDGTEVQQTVLGDDVSIGAGTMLIAPVRVGDGAKTGAGAVVTKDVAPGETVVGVPARSLAVGLKCGMATDA